MYTIFQQGALWISAGLVPTVSSFQVLWKPQAETPTVIITWWLWVSLPLWHHLSCFLITCTPASSADVTTHIIDLCSIPLLCGMVEALWSGLLFLILSYSSFAHQILMYIKLDHN